LTAILIAVKPCCTDQPERRTRLELGAKGDRSTLHQGFAAAVPCGSFGSGTQRILRHTADTSFLGLSAAQLSGSGLDIGIQSKGTAVIHQKDRLPHNNLELFSNAPITTLEHYEEMGFNATVYAGDDLPTKGEALGARFHARVALIYAIETSMTHDDATPENLEITFLEAN
jgi:propanediol dehydratase large subunit